MKTHRYRRVVVWAIVLLIAAWLLPSLISAERYRHSLEARLQQALGRSVHFGSISPELVPRPGFSISDVTVREDPVFGSEPFARVDHIDCVLAPLSLARGRIELARLRLEGATINLVRDASGKWNVDRAVSGATTAPAGRKPPSLPIEVQDARLNFKFGSNKKPFAVTGLDGRVTVDRGRGVVQFDLSGTPVRTDLGLPSPGRLDLTGTWTPNSAGGAVDASLRTRGAMLYDWIPLATGRNPGIYGIVDAEAHITGSLGLLEVQAEGRLAQLRRWESLPPLGDLPINVSVKMDLDRHDGELRFDRVEADFGKSRLVLSGTIAGPGPDPMLDLAAFVEASRLEDFSALAGRLVSRPAAWNVLGTLGLDGMADGHVSMLGRWSRPLYSGSIDARQAHLIVRGLSLPVSDTSINLDGRRADLALTRISATPKLMVAADGALLLPESPAPAEKGSAGARRNRDLAAAAFTGPGFQLRLSVHTAPADQIAVLARNLGLRGSRDIAASGDLSATLAATAEGWPPTPPVLSGVGEIRGAQIGLPGLSRPLEIRAARLQLSDNRVTVAPVIAGLASSIFTGRIEHTGGRAQPWTFDLRAGSLDLAEAATWFEALGPRPSLTWLSRIPGLNTLAARRAAGAALFQALNAQGEFTTPVLAYQGVNLRGFHAHLEMAGRFIRVNSASFRISSGQGEATISADLTGPIPRLNAGFAIAGLRVENWSSHLPPQLGGVRGLAGLSGQLSARGTSRLELESTVEGRGALALANLDLGRFDPLRDTAHMAAWGDLVPSRGPLTLRSATLALEIHSRRLIVEPARFEFGGAVFELSGSCAFDRSAAFQSTADLRHISRRWLEDHENQSSLVTRFLLSGPLDALNATEEADATAAAPGKPE